MQIRINARRLQSHIVAICLLLTLALLQELEGKSISSQQQYFQQQQQQNIKHSSQQKQQHQNQQQTQYQQQQLQQNKNPYGNIFGSASSSLSVVATKRPNSIPNVSSISQQKKPTRHPQLQPSEDNVVDRYNIRYPDGSYEFRYELADGTARYERGYFVRLDKWKKTLVVVGYYAYRLTDGRYLTVFYNADQFGYRQNQSITPETYPNLPRSIDVPQLKDEPAEHPEKITTSDSNHISGTQGNQF